MKQKLTVTILLILFSICHFTALCRVCKPEIDTPFLPQRTIVTEASKKQPFLKLHGKYTCLLDTASGRVLYGSHENEKVAMASTTKIMTCLLALEHGNFNKEVSVSKRAASMPKVHLGMKAGEAYHLKDLLYSLMLISHNDTAVAIAEHIGGSVEGFAAMMNKRAKEIGMTNTNFVTPNGLDANGHYSTAKDMCLLAAEAMKNKNFRELIVTPSHTITELHSKRTVTVTNKDMFLSLYEGAVGIKTGFTSRAGYCFVGAAKKNNALYVCSTLACGWPPNKSYKWSDSTNLMNFGFENYKRRSIPLQTLSNCRIPVIKGNSSFVSCTNVASPVLPVSDFDSITTEYHIPNYLKAPVIQNKKIGTVEIKINDNSVLSLPVYPDKSVAKSTFFDKVFVIFNKFACHYS